jgi:adenosine kinase
MMTPRVLISGSMAYDTIMVFEGHFGDHILPDRVHMLNVAFLTPQLKREFGGTAANIAYNLKALGGQPVVLASVGKDGAEYVQRLHGFGIDVSHVKTFDDAYTAQAFITTDLKDNQITAFHPGAMSYAHEISATGAAAPGAAWGIVSPNGKQAMIDHAAQFKQAGVPFIFDPGQGLPMFSGDELVQFIAQASAVTVNDYESNMLSEKTGLSEQALAQRLPAYIVTRGGEGSTVYVKGQATHIAAASISKAVDPTGCGDAYRGGLLYGLSHNLGWEDSAALGAVMGAIKIENPGPQNHLIDRNEVARRFEASFMRPIKL